MPSPIIAVPCQGADALILLEAETGTRLGSVAVGHHPVHATVVSGTVYVATMGERAVTAISPDGSVERIETGVLGPSHFAGIDDTVFVSCTAGDVVAAIDATDRRLDRRIAVGAEPHELAISRATGHLYVGTRRGGSIDVVDAEAASVRNSVHAGRDARIQGMALASDGTRGFAVDQRNARVIGFDPAPERPAITGTCSVGADPYDLVVADGRLFVPARGDGTVLELDFDLTVRANHSGFERPVDCQFAGGAWWVLDAERAALVNLSGERVALPAPGLSAIVFEDDLIVSHYTDGLVSRVDPTEGEIWRCSVPPHPFGAVVV